MNQALISRSTNVQAALMARAMKTLDADGIIHPDSRRRARTRDHAQLNFEMMMAQSGMMPLNTYGDMSGRRFNFQSPPYAVKRVGTTKDGANDAAFTTYDSTGAFLVGELERLDYTMHMPLISVEYSRDVDMRTDSTVADEFSSFTYSTFASPGGLGAGNGIRNGKAWISKETTQVSGTSVDIAKVQQPLHLWALELKYDVTELESSARVGRPIDVQKLTAINEKHEMDVDEQVYVGDATYADTGLFNSAAVTNVTNVAAGAASSTLWSAKTPAEILSDVNAIIQSTWAASGWAVMPARLMLPPAQFGYISTQIISTGAGNISILKFLLENNVLVATGRGRLEILPSKWLIGAGSGGTLGTTGTVDRMTCYTKQERFVRYPMSGIQRTPIQYDGLWHKAVYYCRLGALEVVYPETLSYRDGI